MGRKKNEDCRKHVTEVENGRKWICNYCNIEYSGGATRIEAHLGLNGKRGGIVQCSKYPPVAGNEGVHNNNNMASTSSNPPPEAVIDRVVYSTQDQGVPEVIGTHTRSSVNFQNNAEVMNLSEDPDRPWNDKATIITETIQVLKDITSEVDRLKTEHKSLSEESSELIQEKNELREEKATLKSDIENLNSQYQQRVRVMPPWTAVDHSVFMSSPYTYPVPMPMPIPPGPVSIHPPPMQPFPYFGNQNPGHIPSLSSMYIPFSAPAIPPIEMPSTQYPSTSHVFSRKESRSKSPGHRRRPSDAERCSVSPDVATELELKMPGSSTQQDCTSRGKKAKHSVMSDRKQLVIDLECEENVIANQLQSLESRGKKRKPEVDVWLKELQEMKGDTPYVSGLIKKMKIHKDKKPLTLSTEFVGKNLDLHIKRVSKLLEDDKVFVVGICGMGGVGKTLLATLVENEVKRKATFKDVFWVTVSHNYSISKLQHDIAKRIGLKLDEDDERIRADNLSLALEKKGKSILILDDVWKYIDLQKVGIHPKVNGIKVILTTRLKHVCHQMDCHPYAIIQMFPLSCYYKENEYGSEDSEDWKLFMLKLGHDGIAKTLPREIKKIARCIVKRFEGLPLAINVMARTMKGIDGIHQWKYALNKLQKFEMGQEVEEEVLKVLKLSYDNLMEKNLQNCFLYCALLSDDDWDRHWLWNGIRKKELIMKLVDNGQINESMCLEEIFDEGNTILDKLESHSLISFSDYFVVTHPLLRNMACYIWKESQRNVIVKSGKELTKIPLSHEWAADLELVHMSDCDINQIPEGMSPNCPKLSTLIINEVYISHVPESFFKYINNLSILDLSYNGSLESLPNSLGELRSLVSLVLEGCHSLKHVPPLGELQALSRLVISSTSIEEAPQGLEKLFNLKWLNLSFNRQLNIDFGSLSSNLIKIQYLDLRHTNALIKVEDIQRMKMLECLGGGFDCKDHNQYMQKKLDLSFGLKTYYLTFAKVYDESVWDLQKYVNLKRFVPGDHETKIIQFGDCDHFSCILPKDLTRLLIIENSHWVCLCDALSYNTSSSLRRIETYDCQQLESLFCLSGSCSFCTNIHNLEVLELRSLESLTVVCKEVSDVRQSLSLSDLRPPLCVPLVPLVPSPPHTHTSHTHPHTHQHTSTAKIASMAPMAPKQCHGSIFPLHFIVSLFPRLLPLFSSIPNLILLCSSVVDNKMVGSADVLVNGLSTNGAVELLPDDFDVSAIIKDPVPLVVADNGIDKEEAKTNGGKEKREIVLGRNIHTTCLEVTEPEADDEITGDRDAHMASVLARYRKSLTERTKYHLGYPYNLDFDYGALSQLQHFSINNLGDPFIESNYGVHSRQFEVGVLDWFARLWELEKNEYWGYITNCGTEGNLHGILVGREVLPDGILYASRESHYSIFKAARMYRMECEKVETLNSGEIDCDDFKAKLLRHQDKPAIINVNIGTTVKGAVDDLDLVIQKLEEAGFSHDRFYIHVDGALFGLMMPFVKRAPKVTFKKPIGSVSVSGHKFVGCPMPCGVQITRLEHINALSRNVEYLASRDATIMGSRNGHAPIFLWYTLNRKGYRGFQKEVQKCLRNAHYFKDRLIEAGIGAMLNELSSTVVFERPHDEEFIRKWQLACKGNIAHVVVMPNVTIEKLDDFLNELVQKRATWFEDGTFQPYCIASDVGENSCLCALHK